MFSKCWGRVTICAWAKEETPALIQIDQIVVKSLVWFRSQTRHFRIWKNIYLQMLPLSQALIFNGALANQHNTGSRNPKNTKKEKKKRAHFKTRRLTA